jgi:hypothetical protein
MSNASTKTAGADNFERIAEDLVQALIVATGALTIADADERRAVKMLVSLEGAAICKRAIALTA